MRYTIVPRAHLDRLEQRIRVLEIEQARHGWLKAQYRALERSHEAALRFIRQHRCGHPAAIPAAASIVHLGDNVVDFPGRTVDPTEVPHGTD